MNKIIAAALILVSSVSMADTTLFKCAIPESKNVSLNIDLADDQSSDFVTISLTEKSGQTVFFSQMEKGSIGNQIKNGFLNLLALTEQSGMVDGVIVNTGFLGLGKENDGSFGGFLSAKGNIYPLSCVSK